ncbi:hypothetical protein HU200_007929 [Digitaria exilis]|uniref:SIAH-type domain-containing protein n=1 Tax=Digitaria exilis TaxID=1010633 RepID=A0A835FNL4_9POAL|nr:hypothetical protein HU200_007929 [Digitaria exilis]
MHVSHSQDSRVVPTSINEPPEAEEARQARRRGVRRIEASAMAEEGEASVSRKKTRITPPPSSVPHGTGSNGSFGDIDEIIIEESQGNGVNLESAVGTEFAEEHEEEPMDTSTGVDEQVSPEPASPSPVVADVTVTDGDALRCGVCFLALRPPIFQVRRSTSPRRVTNYTNALQCEVGHVVCSSCRDKLEDESAAAAAGKKCHVCGPVPRHGAARGLHPRPCPYAAHGCTATPAYHGRDAHALACPHAPCPCPGKACGFIGSTAALLDHFAATHTWPIATNVRAGERFTARLRFGFNFVERLFLLNWTRESLGDAVSVICIHPHATGSASDAQAQCELVFSRYGDDGTLYTRHYQKSEFQVACTDLYDGLPSTDDCFQFVVPDSVLGEEAGCLQVKATIFTS